MNLKRRRFIAAGGLSSLSAVLGYPRQSASREIVGRQTKKGFVEVLLKTNRHAPPATPLCQER